MAFEGNWTGTNGQPLPNQSGLTVDQVYAGDPRTGRTTPVSMDGRTVNVSGDLYINGSGPTVQQTDASYVGNSGNMQTLQQQNLYLQRRLEQEELQLRQMQARLQGGVGAQAWQDPNLAIRYPNQQFVNPNAQFVDPNLQFRNPNLQPGAMGNLVQNQWGQWLPASELAVLQAEGANGGLNWQNIGLNARVGGNYLSANLNPGYFGANANPNYLTQNPALYNPNLNAAYLNGANPGYSGMQGGQNQSYSYWLWQQRQAQIRQQQIQQAELQQQQLNYSTYYAGNNLSVPGYYRQPALTIGNQNFQLGVG